MIEASIILLLLRSILSPLGIYFQLTKLSGDFELNPGPKEGLINAFFMCHSNLNSLSCHNFSKR